MSGFDTALSGLAAFIIGLLLATIIVYAWFKARGTKAGDAAQQQQRELIRLEAEARRAETLAQELRQTRAELAARREEIAGLNSRLEAAQARHHEMQTRFETLNERHEALGKARTELAEKHARLEQEIESSKQREVETTKLLTDTREAMTKEFQFLASKLLEEKGAKLSQQHKETLTSLLAPFNDNLKDFKAKVEQSREDDRTARTRLIEQIRNLTDLNNKLGDQAQSLTKALRGESKTRGMWGEQILQRLLELAGLREGIDFSTQDSQVEEETQRRLIPDVVLKLPQDRAIVVDSKVSLVAYERYCAADDDEAIRAQALKEHCDSLKRHIKELSAKNYHTLYGLKSIDFTLLFVPIESALMAANEADRELSQYALDRHIALVSPNTLFTVLRTVEYIWRAEKTTRNMQDIVKRGGLMYDAARKFGDHILAINAALDKASNAAREAEKALTDPSRGLVRQAEKLREMGVQPKKPIARKLTHAAGVDLEAEAEADADVQARLGGEN